MQTELQTKLTDVLKIADLPEQKRLEFLEEVGTVILQSTILRLLVTLEESQVQELEEYIDTVTPDADLVAHLEQTYPQFSTILSEEVNALQQNFAEVVL